MPHTHDHLCLTVETFIVYNSRVLLRMHEKYHIWLGVGGHVESGEDPNEAAVREAKEETGLIITLVGPQPNIGKDEPAYRQLVGPAFMDRHRVSNTHEHVTLRFFATSDSGKVAPMSAGDRSDEWKWFTEKELDDPVYGIRDTIRYYAKAALDALGKG
ncbi:MAG: NUDIX domain-containing protein [Candidatus Kerfeldbacteria bacterium]